MTATTRRIGVLGLGEGRSILSAALTSPHWQVGQICDLDESLCQARQAEFGLQDYTTDYATMLADPTIDTIAIFTPDPLHGANTLQALEAGKHVICTKPFLDRLDQGRRILDAQKAANKQVMIGQSSRFVESMRRQHADYEAGRNGGLVSIEAHYNHDHRSYMEKPWGSKIDWVFCGLSHPVDLVRWYFPAISEVFGYGTPSPTATRLGLTTPDTMHFVFKEASGRIARVTGIYGLPEPNFHRESLKSCTLRGTLGSSQSDYPQLRYHTHFEGEHLTHEFPELHDYYYRFGPYQHHAGEFENYLTHFASSLDRGATPQPDLQDGLRTVAVMEAMKLSMQNGVPVQVNDVLRSHDLEELTLPSESASCA